MSSWTHSLVAIFARKNYSRDTRRFRMDMLGTGNSWEAADMVGVYNMWWAEHQPQINNDAQIFEPTLTRF